MKKTRELISCEDYVIALGLTIDSGDVRFLNAIRYAKFLKQHLTLGMFVPCDSEGSVLETTPIVHEESGMANCSNEYREQYQQAKDRVVFDGFEVIYIGNSTVFESSDKKVSVVFYKDRIELNGATITKISDLTTYGLKYYEQ